MILPPYLQRWILLNVVRLLTIVSCTLVIASTIRTLVINFHHYPPPLLSSSSSPEATRYYPTTDIPTTFLGVFWSTLHHSSTLLVLVTVILSELSLPIPLLHRLFKNTLPFLGPNWGTGFLGVLLLLIAADSLSRGEVGGRFAEVSAWVLASLGAANVGVGVAWRSRAKVVRSPMGWKAEVAGKLDKLADAKRDAQRVVEGLPLPVGLGNGEKGEDDRGLKGLIRGVGGKLVGRLEERQAKQAQNEEKGEERRNDPEKANPGPNMAIFTPALPSAVVTSRTVAPPPPPFLPPSVSHPPTSTPPAQLSIPQKAAIHPPLRSRTPSTSSSYTISSTYTLDAPPASHPLPFTTTATPVLTTTIDSPVPRESALPSASPPLTTTTVGRPTLKTVRFQSAPKPHCPSTTIDSFQAQSGTSDTPGMVEGSNFLLAPRPALSNAKSNSSGVHLAPPPLDLNLGANDGDGGGVPSADNPTLANGAGAGLIDGERSPSVLASLKAAMLEAQAKASSNKKSLYLGSHRWRAEYEALTTTTGPPPSSTSSSTDEAQPQQQQLHAKQKSEPDTAPRPYNFL